VQAHAVYHALGLDRVRTWRVHGPHRLHALPLDRHAQASFDGANSGSSPQTSTVARELTGAALVGVEVSLLLSPLEMVRIQGQNCGKGGLLSAARAVNATAGGAWWAAWTRGMTATMNRESKYCIGQFFLCEKIAESIATRGCSGGNGGEAAAPQAGFGSQVAGAVLGGIACTAISHPDDVIKTRMQTHLRGSAGFADYPGYLASGRHLLRREGLRSLFHGASFRCLLRVPLGLSVIIVSGSAMRWRLEEGERAAQG